MTDDVRLGREGGRTGWLTAGGLTGCVAAMLAPAAIGWFPFSVVLQVSIPLVAAGVGAVWMLTRRAQDVVVLDDDGVRVEGRAGTRAWADLLEVGAARSAGTVPCRRPA